MTKPLKDLLSTIFAHDSWKYELLSKWKTIMGAISSKARIEKILDDTIVLAVENSCWMQELYMLSPILIKTINQNLDKPRIKQLRFKKAGIFREKKAVVKKNKQTQLPGNIDLTIRQKKALADIEDKELRNSLEKFLIRCQGENR